MTGADGIARTILVTGGTGCLGAWVVRRLLDAGDRPVVFSRGEDLHRLRLLLSEDELRALELERGDVSDTSSVEAALDRQPVAAVIPWGARRRNRRCRPRSSARKSGCRVPGTTSL